MYKLCVLVNELRLRENRSLWFLTRSDINRSVQSQKKARILKFWVNVEEKFCIYVAKTKELITCAVTAELTCDFVFA